MTVLWVCGQCTAAYAPGLPACPQCGGTVYRPDYEEDAMASSNVTTAGVFWDEGSEPPGYVDPRTGDGQPAVDLPADRAPKAEWAAHAVTVAGVPPVQAESMTKAELQETVKAAVPPPPPPPPGA